MKQNLALIKLKTARGLMALLVVMAGNIVQANTFSVTTTADAGAGSLREAITSANGAVGSHTINFAIPGAGIQTITLASSLPALTQAITINGYSQSGSVPGPIATRTVLIKIDGNNAAIPGSIIVNASNCTISGIRFVNQKVGAVGITIGNGLTPSTQSTVTVLNTWIWGCLFQIDDAGTGMLGLGGGVRSEINNIISTVSNIRNITIGTNGDGSNDANEGNQFCRPVTGVAAAGSPIYLLEVDNVVIAGNYFALDKAGNNLLTGSNAGTYGLLLEIDNNKNTRIGTDGNGVSDVLERNVFGGNGMTVWDAITIGGNSADPDLQSYWGSELDRFPSNNLIAGNYIGVAANGTTALPIRYGIKTYESDGNTFGSTTDPAVKNVISNCLIGISSFECSGNTFANNYIGVRPDGTTAASNNLAGIVMDAQGHDNYIFKNIIANGTLTVPDASNEYGGIIITSWGGITETKISQNSIYGNRGLGITLEPTAAGGTVRVNDGILEASDFDIANQFVDYPIILKGTEVNAAETSLFVRGFVGSDSTATGAAQNGVFAGSTVEIFIGDDVPADNNGAISTTYTTVKPHAEGKTYIGSAIVGSDGRFSGTFDVTGLGITAATILTGTTTTPAGSTSEFGVQMVNTTVSTPLPVTLSDFHVAPEGRCAALVQWTTADESDIDHFTVEYSADGKSFRPAYTVASRKNTMGSVYRYYHKDLKPGNAMFRLRLDASDGTAEYSITASLYSDCGATVYSISPNPAQQTIYIQAGDAEMLQVTIVNPVGQTVKTVQLGKSDRSVTISDLAAGTYIIRVLEGNKIRLTTKLVKW